MTSSALCLMPDSTLTHAYTCLVYINHLFHFTVCSYSAHSFTIHPSSFLYFFPSSSVYMYILSSFFTIHPFLFIISAAFLSRVAFLCHLPPKLSSVPSFLSPAQPPTFVSFTHRILLFILPSSQHLPIHKPWSLHYIFPSLFSRPTFP